MRTIGDLAFHYIWRSCLFWQLTARGECGGWGGRGVGVESRAGAGGPTMQGVQGG